MIAEMLLKLLSSRTRGQFLDRFCRYWDLQPPPVLVLSFVRAGASIVREDARYTIYINLHTFFPLRIGLCKI